MNENRVKRFVQVKVCQVERPMKRKVVFTFTDGRAFEVTTWESGAIGVWRTVNGEPALRQVLPKTFWSLDDAIRSYAGLNKIADIVREEFPETVSA